MHRQSPNPSPQTVAYRLVVAGPIGDRWADWFGADRVISGPEETEIIVRVTDQSELFGRLRRLQDLNLQILEVDLLPNSATGLPGS